MTMYFMCHFIKIFWKCLVWCFWKFIDCCSFLIKKIGLSIRLVDFYYWRFFSYFFFWPVLIFFRKWRLMVKEDFIKLVNKMKDGSFRKDLKDSVIILFVVAIIIGVTVGFTYIAGVWPKILPCIELPCNNSGVVIFEDDLLNGHQHSTIGTYNLFNDSNGTVSYIKRDDSQKHPILYLYSSPYDHWMVSDTLGDTYGYIYNPTCKCSHPTQCASKWEVVADDGWKKDPEFVMKCNTCDQNPCQNGGTCSVPTGPKPFECECAEGFFGEICDGKYCTNDDDCSNFEPDKYCVKGTCNQRLCNFYNGDIDPDIGNNTSYDVATDQECADAIKMEFIDATGAMWFKVQDITHCESRYGTKLDRFSDNGGSACLFADPCSENSDCQGKYEICQDDFCYDDKSNILFNIILNIILKWVPICVAIVFFVILFIGEISNTIELYYRIKNSRRYYDFV